MMIPGEDPPGPTQAKRVRKNRYGMTVGKLEVEALLALFRAADRGGDLRVLMRTSTIRRFRASLQRIKDGTRMRYGGRKREDPVAAEDEERDDQYHSPLPLEDLARPDAGPEGEEP